MDPLAAWVNLEPPLTAAGSGPAIAVRVGPRRGAARRRRVHPSVGACAGEGAHGDTNVLLPSLLCGEARMRREEARKEMVS
jgi:hypothetical protein